MPQINEYVNEVLVLKSEDLFDIDKFTNLDPPNGPYQSQKLKYSTLLSMIQSEIDPTNLGNSNLTQQPATSARTYNGNGGLLTWNQLAGMNVELSPTAPLQSGFRIAQNNVGAPVIGNMLQSWEKAGTKIANLYEDGSFALRRGSHYVGDGTGVLIGATSQPDNRFLSLMSSATKTTVITDQPILAGPIPQDSVAWFNSSSKGVLFPNMNNAQRNAIPTPRAGLIIYNSQTNRLQVNEGVFGWNTLT